MGGGFQQTFFSTVTHGGISNIVSFQVMMFPTFPASEVRGTLYRRELFQQLNGNHLKINNFYAIWKLETLGFVHFHFVEVRRFETNFYRFYPFQFSVKNMGDAYLVGPITVGCSYCWAELQILQCICVKRNHLRKLTNSVAETLSSSGVLNTGRQAKLKTWWNLSALAKMR